MGLSDKIALFRDFKSGIKHCTFNPEGPGVVRIHLLPPKFSLFGTPRYLVILNGYYILPLGHAWALMLSRFISLVNRYDGKPIDDSALEEITHDTVKYIGRLYPLTDEKKINGDLDTMLTVLFAVARGEACEVAIEKLSVRSYQKHMRAPHRVDLMVSSMCDSDGKWKCNQKCRFCYAKGGDMGLTHELSSEEWKRIIDKLWASGVAMLTFTGGEPTQREDLCDLIAYSKRFVTRLNTNGVLLTEEMCQKLKRASIDSVQITLYSADRDIHNSLTGSENYEKTIEGIQNALRAGLDVSVNTPLCKENRDYLKTLSFLSELGVRFVTVSGLIPAGGAKTNSEEDDVLTPDELGNIVTQAKQYTNEHGMEIDFTSPGQIRRELLEALGMNVPSCGAALSNMAISPSGEVLPCQSWLEKGCSLGNILVEDFKKIYNHKTAKELRALSEDEAERCQLREE